MVLRMIRLPRKHVKPDTNTANETVRIIQVPLCIWHVGLFPTCALFRVPAESDVADCNVARVSVAAALQFAPDRISRNASVRKTAPPPRSNRLALHRFLLLCVLCYVVVILSNYCVTFASLIRLRHRVYSARGCSMGGPCRGVVGPSGRCWQEILHFHYAYDTASCIRTTLRGCVRVLVCMWVRLVCVYVNAGVIIIIIIVVVVALSRRTSMLG